MGKHAPSPPGLGLMISAFAEAWDDAVMKLTLPSNLRQRADASRGLRARLQHLRYDSRVRVRGFKNTLLYGTLARVKQDVTIPLIGREGFCSNVIHVLEVLHCVRPDANVHIDWTLTGNESDFKYGQVGDNVWELLFAQISPPRPPGGVEVAQSLDPKLWGSNKDRLTDAERRRQREEYHEAWSRYVRITNRRILDEVARIEEQSMRGRCCIGVHKRVANRGVRRIQADGKLADVTAYIETARAAAQKRGRDDFMVYLATDDVSAVAPFREAFGDRLVVREGVQRATPEGQEVHGQDWDRVSLADAEDIVIDTVLLSKCEAIVHAASSVSTMAAFINPKSEQLRVAT